MCSLQRNYDVIRNWARFETGPLTVEIFSFMIYFCREGLFFNSANSAYSDDMPHYDKHYVYGYMIACRLPFQRERHTDTFILNQYVIVISCFVHLYEEIFHEL